MAKAKRIIRKLTPEERVRHAQARAEAIQAFPHARTKKHQLVRTGLAARLRQARKAQGLTYYSLAKRAGIPNPNTVKDVEYGRDARLSNIEAIAKALGLKLELVEAS